MTEQKFHHLLIAMTQTLEVMASGPTHRYKQTRLFKNIVVSTVDTPDEGPETGISDGSKWFIVQRYGRKAAVEEIMAGHDSWVQRICAGEREFTEVGKPGWGIDPEPFTLSVQE